MKKVLFACILICVILFSVTTALSLTATLDIPDNVLIIEQMAFYGDSSLDVVVLPEGVKEIREKAFAESSVRKINLPASLTSIADNAFDTDKNIKISAVKGTYAYDWAVGKGFNVAADSTEWGDFMCEYFPDGNGGLIVHITGLKDFWEGTVPILPQELNGQTVSEIYIDDGAFENNELLTIMPLFPDSLKQIGKRAFAGCVNLCCDTDMLMLPAGIELIDDSAFQGCIEIYM